MALTGVLDSARGDVRGCISRSNVLALELGQQTLIRLAKGARVTHTVEFTGTAKVRLAVGIGRSIGRGEERAINRVFDRGGNILESITLGQDVATFTDFKSVAGVVVPVVVNL